MDFSWPFFVILALSFLQIAFLVKSPFQFQMRKILAVEYFENCDGKEYPYSYVRFSFKRNGTFTFVSGEEILTRDIKSPVSIQNQIERCGDKSNPDTCEYYTTWKWDHDVCAIFKVFPFCKEYIDAHKPPFECPGMKNHYYLENFKIPSDFVAPFLGSMSNNPRTLWKFRVSMTEASEVQPVACLQMGLKVASIRVRV